MTHPTDDEIDALADKHIKYQLEGHKVSGVHDFARALLAEQARTEPVPLSDCGQLMEAIRGTAALLFGQGAAQQYPFATWRLLESYIDQMIAIVNAAARSAPPPPLKAEQAKDVAEDAELLEWLEEKHYALHPIKEDQGDDTYTLWWQVTDKDKSISGHPLGDIRAAIRAARAAERKA